MSDSIDDEGAIAFTASLVPSDPFLGYCREIATTGQVTLKGEKRMGSQLLYPFYGDKNQPDTVVRTPDYWFTTTVSIPHHAGQIGAGQSVVVLVNALPHALDVTRPLRNGGWMLGIPHDGDGTANRIPGAQEVEGTPMCGIGAYANGIASLFWGSGAILALSAHGGAVPTMLVAYGSGINGGLGLGIEADMNRAGTLEDWYAKTADKADFTPCGALMTWTSDVKMTASAAAYDRPDSDGGGLFTVVVEPA